MFLYCNKNIKTFFVYNINEKNRHKRQKYSMALLIKIKKYSIILKISAINGKKIQQGV